MKLLRLIIGLVTISVLFLFSESISMAAGSADQSCKITVGSPGTMSIANRTDSLNQSFVPTQNRLSRVILDLQGDGVGQIYLYIIRVGTGPGGYFPSISSMPEPNGRGFVQFLFNDLVLEPGVTYNITPVVLEGNTKLYWYYQNNCYDKGDAYTGFDVVSSKDFGFETYGFTYEFPSIVIPNNIVNPPTATPTTVATVSPTATAKATATPTTVATVTPATTATATPTKVTEDTSIESPSLEYVLINFNKLDKPKETLEVAKTDSLVLYGLGEKNTKVQVIFDKNIYQVNTNVDGEWFLQIPLGEIKAGTYTITGQTIKGDKGSEIIGLLKINLKGEAAGGAIGEAKIVLNNLYVLIVLIALLILVGIGFVVGYFINKRNKAEKIEKQVDKPQDEAVKSVEKETLNEVSNEKKKDGETEKQTEEPPNETVKPLEKK